jgi:phage shock protein E
VERRTYGRSAAALALALALAACGGGGDDPPAAAPAAQAPAASVTGLTPAQFAERMKATTGMVVNVHVPDEGEIPGTDAHIDYRSIASGKQLPADKATELLLYCRSGRMSAEAGAELVRAGWTNVAELTGGFEAWKAAGRTFTAPA